LLQNWELLHQQFCFFTLDTFFWFILTQQNAYHAANDLTFGLIHIQLLTDATPLLFVYRWYPYDVDPGHWLHSFNTYKY
jgi:hypothetical protein